MKSGLQEINQLVGIWGSLIIDNQGGMILNISPPGLSEETLMNISNQVIDLLNSSKNSLAGVNEALLHYANRKIFIHDLDQVILVVICTPSVDISLLRMTTNVVVTNWRSDPKIQKKLNKSFIER